MRDDNLFEVRPIPSEEVAFQGYDFGEGVEVHGTNGWERSTDSREMSRKVFVSVDSDGCDTTMLTFTVVKAENGSVAECYAMDGKGVMWGGRPVDGQERSVAAAAA